MNNTTLLNKRVFIAIVLVLGVLVGTALVAAQDGIITACINGENGNTRIVASSADCQQPEYSIQWNITGPQGQMGPQGPQGLPGEPGIPGQPGAQGFSALAVLTPEAVNCVNGGQRIDIGLDNGDNGGIAYNGVLESGEIDTTAYLCNGAPGPTAPQGQPGADGNPGSAGLACWDTDGNGMFTLGEDRNLDGILDANDCQGPQGVAGADGAQGEQGLQGPQGLQGEPGNLALAGQSCPTGQFVTGFDANSDPVCGTGVSTPPVVINGFETITVNNDHATCPSGKVVVGGSARHVLRTSDDINQFLANNWLRGSYPDSDHRWSVEFPLNGRLEVSAHCVDAQSVVGYQIVDVDHGATLTCPDDKQLLGGGANGVQLIRSRPIVEDRMNGLLRMYDVPIGWEARGYSPQGPVPVDIWAICGSPVNTFNEPMFLQVHTGVNGPGPGAGGFGLPQLVQTVASCADGGIALSGGFSTFAEPSLGGDNRIIESRALQSTHSYNDSWSVLTYANTRNDIQAYVICTAPPVVFPIEVEN